MIFARLSRARKSMRAKSRAKTSLAALVRFACAQGRCSRITVLAAAVLFCLPLAAVPKQALGAIAGRVTDQKNAPVPLVRVSAVKRSDGAKFSTETGHSGRYRLSAIPPGIYRVTFINPAFQMAEFRKIRVLAGKTVTLNLKLRVTPCPNGGCR
jgi:hypothetical protein